MGIVFKNEIAIDRYYFNASFNLEATCSSAAFASGITVFMPYSPERFGSDFIVQYLSGKSISSEAQKVLVEGKKLWQAYFAYTDVRTLRDDLKLNRADVGWYQIRKALQARNESGDFPPVSFEPLEEAYKVVTEKLQPQVC